MAKAQLKTRPTGTSVAVFLQSIEDRQKRKDAKTVRSIMKKITGARPRLWGTSIVGFGTYHYKYASGREGDWMMTGFSPRKQALTIYIMNGFNRYGSLMKKLGRYKTGKSCLYIKHLSDIDLDVLTRLIERSWKDMQTTYSNHLN